MKLCFGNVFEEVESGTSVKVMSPIYLHPFHIRGTVIVTFVLKIKDIISIVVLSFIPSFVPCPGKEK